MITLRTLALCLLLSGCATGEALYYANQCGLDPYQCKIQQPKER